MGTIDRRIVLVTGTSSGIGAAVARLALERGWTVCGVARRPAQIEHDRYEHVALDLGQVGELDVALGPRLRSRLSEAPSRVGLVNNAASLDLLGRVEDIDLRTPAGGAHSEHRRADCFDGADLSLLSD
jgi:NADP-dependent 3-hydroxy acid dehydrogenase YdfG